MARQSLFRAEEPARLDPFVIVAGDASPRDQRDLMERPFFSLSKSRRVRPILYRAGEVEVHVHGLPEHGMATIWDADVLIWAASQIVDAENRGLPTSRLLRFTPYQLLTGVGRATGATEYRLFKAALRRLQSTVVATTIRQGEQWRRQQFSWINEWEERANRQGRVEGVEVVLPEWFYRGVVDRSLVLTIDPHYFRLTGGIERWLYRVARKHAGRQVGGWVFELAHLHHKSGSLARPSDFALDIRRIVARQPLPGYRLMLERGQGRERLRILPLVVEIALPSPVDGVVTSGAADIGTSGAPLSGDRAQGPTSSPSGARDSRAPNLDSNSDSNFLAAAVLGAEPGR
ncbi:replication initiator protein A [Caulobacter segnis]|uniref:replication initiator protein A n=1 Tax=Caulobacter segnis TaxID=88688 RepID=UPI00285DD013|nr:replication initiator protein A [Caulobacter segnis]MDR6624493.1 plasmid replication initiation protein [Caulobacter segnis]